MRQITAKRMTTTQMRLRKEARASREMFLCKHSGVMTNAVTKKTTRKRTMPIDAPHDGTIRTMTLLRVSPTTTLYEIIAAIMSMERN